jgi:hypothetical protein
MTPLGWLLAAAAGVFVFDRLMLNAEERGWIDWRKRMGSHGMPSSTGDTKGDRQ